MSSNALKVRFLLAELGLEYQRRHVALARPRPDWYTRVNPFGGVPTLEDGDLQLAESNAIARYLATREGREDLYPVDPTRRARVDWALDAWSTSTRPALFRLELPVLFETGDFETGAFHPERADAAKVERALPGAAEALACFERFAEEDGTVCGGGFTIADACVAPVLFRSLALPLSFEDYPRLVRIRETVMARPAFAAAGPVA